MIKFRLNNILKFEIIVLLLLDLNIGIQSSKIFCCRQIIDINSIKGLSLWKKKMQLFFKRYKILRIFDYVIDFTVFFLNRSMNIYKYFPWLVLFNDSKKQLRMFLSIIQLYFLRIKNYDLKGYNTKQLFESLLYYFYKQIAQKYKFINKF
ncbi:unnamed protein product [Paramecium pentaurelia]|uniref:Transmembrane protein n=1 Tax=Paramecium pentaurelia TaxID=43138 RepID=A0A8S1W0A4_9CILI|nr:unnamed protein product [Paramecium pentaurelia]